jgi:hypothetical protein
MNDASTVKRNDDTKEDQKDNGEAALEVALPPPPPLPSLERQTHHTPPGAFAMSLGATPQEVSGSMVLPRRGGARRCRTNSCDTHATMSLEDEEDDYVEQIMHHVPVAELVLSTNTSMVSSISGSFTNNNPRRLYDVEIAQEVYGGQVIPGDVEITPHSDARTMTRQVWKRALLLAVVMTLLLVAIVGTAKAVRQSSSSSNEATGTVSTRPPVTSKNNNLTPNTTTSEISPQEPPEDETSRDKYLSIPKIIPCQDENTTLATQGSLLVCFVAKGIKDELGIPLNETKSGNLDDTWEISCPGGRTIVVNDHVRLALCERLAQGNATLSEVAAAAAANETDSTPKFPWLQALLQRSIP